MLCSFAGISNEIEYAVIGAVLLIGTILDEMLKPRCAARVSIGPPFGLVRQLLKQHTHRFVVVNPLDRFRDERGHG